MSLDLFMDLAAMRALERTAASHTPWQERSNPPSR